VIDERGARQPDITGTIPLSLVTAFIPAPSSATSRS
jgi:hypothetical protein